MWLSGTARRGAGVGAVLSLVSLLFVASGSAMGAIPALPGPVVRGGDVDQLGPVAVSGSHVWAAGFGGLDEFTTGGQFVQLDDAPDLGLDGPDALLAADGHLFVANDDGNSVTELDASTGDLVQVLSGPAYAFNYPDALAVSGTDLFVLNGAGGTVTELDAATGALVRVVSASSLYGGNSLAVEGNDLFVGDSNDDHVAEVDYLTGSVVYDLSAYIYHFDSPKSLAVSGDRLFVLNRLGDSITEISTASGAPVRLISGRRYRFSDPMGMALEGTNLWVASAGDASLTELAVPSGMLERVVSDKKAFPSTLSLIAAGRHLWLTERMSSAVFRCCAEVTEASAATGRPLQELTGYAFSGPLATAGPYLLAKDGNAIAELGVASGSVLRVISGPQYHFHFTAMVARGADVWALNEWPSVNGAPSVTEVNARTGRLIRIIAGSRYDFRKPTAMVTNGRDVFVANITGNSVTEFSATTGRLVKRFAAERYELDGPDGLALVGPDLFVSNGAGPSISELDVKTGAMVRLVLGYATSGEIATNGAVLFIPTGGDAITEISTSTGAVAGEIAGDEFSQIYRVVGDGTHLWVSNCGMEACSVIELDEATGALVRVVAGQAYGFEGPTSIATDGVDVWVWNSSVGTLTGFPAG